MRFAINLPPWAFPLLISAAGIIAWASYAGVAARMPRAQLRGLVLLRTATLVALVICLLRPVRIVPPQTATDAIVPVLVDVSRSMGLADAGGQPRIEAAGELLDGELLPALKGTFAPEVWTFGDSLRPYGGALRAEDRRSDLAGALREIRERYRDRRVAGVIVISDGSDTGTDDVAGGLDGAAVPVYTIGVGAPHGSLDYEILDIAAGDAGLTGSSIDITVSAIGRGSDAPFDIRLLENGSPIDVRRVTPSGDGTPVQAVFTVVPGTGTATVYTAEIPSLAAEAVTDNNRRSVAVDPPGAARRLLVIEGAPGFEHAFLKRALAADPGLEVDSVVRKGRDTSGRPTYFVQASGERAPLLSSGFPKDRASLYGYDAVVLANVDPDTLTGVQLEELARFVGERGGGLLVLGAKSFTQPGLGGTPIDEVLPVRLSGRSREAVEGPPAAVNLTEAGAAHPVMRVAATDADATNPWKSVPPLPGASPVGEPRPGATVLATVRSGGAVRPLIALQRYGHGRSMVFTGEASWRWRMQMPSSDRTYELFWRQAARWLALGARGRVTVASPPSLLPGDSAPLGLEIRDSDFAPVTDADVTLRVAGPDGATADLRPALVDVRSGRYAADMRFPAAGLYRVSVEARRGRDLIGSSDRWVLVGAADSEVADPRLHDNVLRRVSRASGGQYFSAADVPSLPALLRSAAESAPPRLEEVWHSIWMFALIVMLLTSEWMLRRRWGLR